MTAIQTLREAPSRLPSAPGSAAASVAVLIPCYNEAPTIASVVRSFRAALPHAEIFVYDNNSSDGTAGIAREAGAIVRTERRQGKGHVVRRMFRDVDADIYVIVDGDGTYDAAAAPRLIDELISGPYDKVNAARAHTSKAAYRPGHVLGNKLLTRSVSAVFGSDCSDMLSGYKALSRRFVKTFPATSTGFEIETELLVHALDLDLPMSEIETVYGERQAGSVSKLSTYRDGLRILALITHLVRDLKPLQFFSALGLAGVLLAAVLGSPVVVTYFETGLVPRLPTAVLATGVMTAGLMSFGLGLLLDSVSRGRRETKWLALLTYPPVNG